MLLQSCSTFYHSVIKPQDLRHSDLRDNCKSVHYCVFHLTRVMPIPGKNITNVLKMSTVSHDTLCVVGVDADNAVTPSTGPPTAGGVLYIQHSHRGDGTIPTVRKN